MDKGWRGKKAVVLHIHVFPRWRPRWRHICPLRQAISDCGYPRVPTLFSSCRQEEQNTRETRAAPPPLAKSKSVTRGTRENQTRHGCGAHVSKAATTPGPAAASTKAGRAGGQIRLVVLTGVGGDPTQAVPFRIGGEEAWEARTPNYATVLAGLQAPFFVDQSLSRMGFIMGEFWGCGWMDGCRRAPLPSSLQTPASPHRHPFTLPFQVYYPVYIPIEPSFQGTATSFCSSRIW